MKDYFNREERRDFILFKKSLDVAESILNKWKLTKYEHKNMSSSLTFGLKAYESILAGLNSASLKTLAHTLQQTAVTVEDKYAIKMYNKKLETDIDKSYEENKDYFKLVELLMYIACKDCVLKCSECTIYNEFETHMIPGSDCNKENCKYSY